MNVLYHITKEKYLNKILSEGIKTNTKHSGFCKFNIIKEYHKNYGMQPIFLTSDVDYIIYSQLTSEYIKKHKMIILEINTDNLELENEYNYIKNKFYDVETLCLNNKTFISRKNIETNRIIKFDLIK